MFLKAGVVNLRMKKGCSTELNNLCPKSFFVWFFPRGVLA